MMFKSNSIGWHQVKNDKLCRLTIDLWFIGAAYNTIVDKSTRLWDSFTVNFFSE